MKTLLFVPEDCEPEYIMSIVSRRLPETILVCSAEHLPSDDDSIREYSCVIGWIQGRPLLNGRSLADMDPGLDLLLRTAPLRKITIGIGASLDRQAKVKLQEAGVCGYVSQSNPRAFESELEMMIAGFISGCDQNSTRFANVCIDTIGVFSESMISWFTDGGYSDRIYSKVRHGWHEPISRLFSSRPVSDKREEWSFAEDVGSVLSDLMFPQEHWTEFYSHARGAVGDEVSRMPMILSYPREFSNVPFELAQLPLPRRRPNNLIWFHPVHRLVSGSAQSSKWQIPQSRGIRILLVACNVSGNNVECPLGSPKCLPAGRSLSGLGSVDDEVREIESILKEAEKDGLIQLKEPPRVIESQNATYEVVEQALNDGDWDIFHFAGHGLACYLRSEPDGCLVLKGSSRWHLPKAINLRYWAAQASGNANPELVYLSCCRGIDSGLIHCLAGAKHGEVVGYFQNVADSSACRFAKFFYEGIIEQIREIKQNNPDLASNSVDVASAMLYARKRMFAGRVEDWLAACFSVVCLGSSKEVV